ncbi:YicC/YloC family endoribonuclease [Sneathiella sp.]|uniref:YicC/YloC family endoribonuclease n=1 Tax=Sneathiella sp. TaxID=1964365 RepID=UPI0025D33ADD|nr:YicC/YloC family endoribonuclease [Sneathiella sp.]
MSINSMTGFARASGAHDGVNWLWEMKSVNGRGLEIRCRFPAGFDFLEDRLRKLVKSRFERGSVNLHLQFENRSAAAAHQVNEEFLRELIALSGKYVAEGTVQAPRMDGLLALRGVIEFKDDPLAGKDMEALEGELLASADLLMTEMARVRAEEGGQLRPVLLSQLDVVDTLVKRAAILAAGWPERIREKIQSQMALILEAGSVDEGRLEQELALLTTKADIAEELDRLTGHIKATRDILNATARGSVGRRLDFICQEFNREANTLCSKANDRELTQIGLDLKVAIDKMREQVQNIE